MMMKPQHLLLLLPIVEAYVNRKPGRAPFHSNRKLSAATAAPIAPPEAVQYDIINAIAREANAKSFMDETQMTLREAEAVHSMPWQSSIDPRVTDEELLYMPFWNWQMDFLESNLSNLEVVPCHNGKTDFSYNVNTKKKARIVNVCLKSDEYSKIRMTYYDAGDNTQVFNAVFYPRAEYNLPVLGIDLLAFNRKKYLGIVDFQPIHDDEADHAQKYEHLLSPIKQKYESLQGQMSAKFYDETKFFSKQMLFARFEDEQVIPNEMFPAFQGYVQTHLDLLKSTKPNKKQAAFVAERQRQYDIYSAERDPAAGLFSAMYGEEWADEFMHDFLFSKSRTKPAAETKVNRP